MASKTPIQPNHANAMTREICVLTGDIVRSSSLSNALLEALIKSLQRISDDIRSWSAVPSPPLERFRGDGWQLALTEPSRALRAGLLVRAAIKSCHAQADSRIGFGVGAGAIKQSLATSSGPAFELSGELLDELNGPDRWAYGHRTDNSTPPSLASALFVACEAVSSTWTSRQAEVFSQMIQPERTTLHAVADRLDISPQAVQTHFSKAGGRALSHAVKAFERAMEKNQP